jgi:hypothetical protein
VQRTAQNYQDLLLSQQLLNVKLDACTGLLGGDKSTLSCGQTYVIQYPGAPGTTPKGDMCEKVWGLDAQRHITKVCGGYCNSNPQTVADIGHGTTRSIDLFGRVLYYNDAGEVFDRDSHSLIGHLEIVPPQAAEPGYIGICSCHDRSYGCNGDQPFTGKTEEEVNSKCRDRVINYWKGHGGLSRITKVESCAALIHGPISRYCP